MKNMDFLSDIYKKSDKKSIHFCRKKYEKNLTYSIICDKILYVELSTALIVLTAKRYARKRKVAVGVAGNFRGVCPIFKPGDRDNGHSLWFFDNMLCIIISICA